MNTLSCFQATPIISSVHGWPMCPPTIRSSGNVSATSSRYGTGRPVSEGISGPVCPTCVQNGMSSSMHLTYSGKYSLSLGGRFHSQGTMRSALKPSSLHRALQLAHRRHRLFQIDRGHAHEPLGKLADQLGHLVVGDDPLPGPAPGRQHHALDAGGVHQAHHLLGP